MSLRVDVAKSHPKDNLGPLAEITKKIGVEMTLAAIKCIIIEICGIETPENIDKVVIAGTMTEIQFMIDTGDEARKRWTSTTKVCTRAGTKHVADTETVT